MICKVCGAENPVEYKFCDACGAEMRYEVEEITCPNCAHTNPGDMKFCEECGARLDVLACPSCSHENPRDFKFCEECGKKIDQTFSSRGSTLAKEKTNWLKLTISMLMRSLVGSLFGFGIERAVNWLLNIVLAS